MSTQVLPLKTTRDHQRSQWRVERCLPALLIFFFLAPHIQPDPLPSGNDGPCKRAVLDFVAQNGSLLPLKAIPEANFGPVAASAERKSAQILMTSLHRINGSEFKVKLKQPRALPQHRPYRPGDTDCIALAVPEDLAAVHADVSQPVAPQ